MPIRAVIFDLGGVLVRTEDRQPRQQLASRLQMNYAELSDLVFENESARLATLGKVTASEHWETLRRVLDLTPEEFDRVRVGFWGGDSLDQELVDFIRSLRPAYKTALLSNAWDNLRRVLVEDWQIADAFDEIIISAEVGVAKPEEHIYEITLERLGVAPAEAVFVDDFIENVKAAQRVGLHAIHFKSSQQALSELRELVAVNTDE
jgi:glucose-1-phosphatase